MEILLTLGILLPLLLGSAYLLGRHFNRRQQASNEMSPVTRQHLDLFQGGSLNEVAVEATKLRFQEMLDRGETAAVEASLRPGTHFVFQVRALAEIGTDEAGRILERQFHRRLTDNPLEQSLYWIDLAHGLRTLNRGESLRQLLRFADKTEGAPLRHFLAAEMACFIGFAGYLQQPDTVLGRAAVRVLLRALEGLRHGVPPAFVSEARLGEVIETLWDHRTTSSDPLLIRVVVESCRWLRRAPQCRDLLGEDPADHEAYDWQLSRLKALEPAWMDFLREAPRELCDRLHTAQREEVTDILLALRDLRASADSALMPLMERLDPVQADLAMEVLAWSGDADTGFWLRDWISRRVPMAQRARKRAWWNGGRSSRARRVPYRAALSALRGFPSVETESFLLLAARDRESRFRAAALGSFGWWEPVRRAEVLGCLQEARKNADPDVRQAARTALARLGERQALQWFRQALTAEDPEQVHDALQVIAGEGLVLLWPDLDHLADSENLDIALHARETVERFREEMDYSRTGRDKA